MPAINELIIEWDNSWQQGYGCKDMNTYRQQKNSDEGRLMTLSQRHNGQRLWTDHDSFCGSCTQRYYGSQVREKKAQLIRHVNTCLEQVNYRSEKISVYQHRIQEIQRIIHNVGVLKS